MEVQRVIHKNALVEVLLNISTGVCTTNVYSIYAVEGAKEDVLDHIEANTTKRFSCAWSVHPDAHLLSCDVVHEDSTGLQQCVALFTVPISDSPGDDSWVIAVVVPVCIGMQPTIAAHIRDSGRSKFCDGRQSSHTHNFRAIDGPCIVWMNHSSADSTKKDCVYVGLPLLDTPRSRADGKAPTSLMSSPSTLSKVLTVPTTCCSPSCSVCAHADTNHTPIKRTQVMWGGTIVISTKNPQSSLRPDRRKIKKSVLILQRARVTQHTTCNDFPMFVVNTSRTPERVTDDDGDQAPSALQCAQLHGIRVAALVPAGAHCTALHVADSPAVVVLGCAHSGGQQQGTASIVLYRPRGNAVFGNRMPVEKQTVVMNISGSCVAQTARGTRRSECDAMRHCVTLAVKEPPVRLHYVVTPVVVSTARASGAAVASFTEQPRDVVLAWCEDGGGVAVDVLTGATCYAWTAVQMVAVSRVSSSHRTANSRPVRIVEVGSHTDTQHPPSVRVAVLRFTNNDSTRGNSNQADNTDAPLRHAGHEHANADAGQPDATAPSALRAATVQRMAALAHACVLDHQVIESQATRRMQRKIALVTAAETMLRDAMNRSSPSHLPPPSATLPAGGDLLGGLPMRVVWTSRNDDSPLAPIAPQHGTSAVCADVSQLLLRVVRVSQLRRSQQLIVHVTVQNLGECACRLTTSVIPTTAARGFSSVSAAAASYPRSPSATTRSNATEVPPGGTAVVTAAADIFPLESALDSVRFTVMLHHQALGALHEPPSASTPHHGGRASGQCTDSAVLLGTGVCGPHLRLEPHKTELQYSTLLHGFADHLRIPEVEHSDTSTGVRMHSYDVLLESQSASHSALCESVTAAKDRLQHWIQTAHMDNGPALLLDLLVPDSPDNVDGSPQHVVVRLSYPQRQPERLFVLLNCLRGSLPDDTVLVPYPRVLLQQCVDCVKHEILARQTANELLTAHEHSAAVADGDENGPDAMKSSPQSSNPTTERMDARQVWTTAFAIVDEAQRATDACFAKLHATVPVTSMARRFTAGH
eukprot:m.685306 g.685306  ORF g.685306 m.685306 type:complete len:1038 (-) comp22838_c0_seq1:102-3215(-)